MSEQAYKEILDVCCKYKELKLDGVNDMIISARDALEVIRWEKDYGIELPVGSKPYSYSFFAVKNDHMAFSYFGKDSTISWPDDGRQPSDEWLLKITFPTGAYIFGKEYDFNKSLFDELFEELKTYKPDYCDSMNHSLYWSLPNAKAIYDCIGDILRRYHEKNKSLSNAKRAYELRKELEELEG